MTEAPISCQCNSNYNKKRCDIYSVKSNWLDLSSSDDWRYEIAVTGLLLTAPRRYFCCGSLLLLVLAVRIYTLVHLLCEWHVLVKFRYLNDHLCGKELFIRFTARKLLLIYVFSYFPFGFEGRIWDLIVSVPDHYLSFYFLNFSCKRYCCMSVKNWNGLKPKNLYFLARNSFDCLYIKSVPSFLVTINK